MINVDKIDTPTSIIVIDIFIVDSYVITSNESLWRIYQNEAINDFDFSGVTVNNNSSHSFSFEIDRELFWDV